MSKTKDNHHQEIETLLTIWSLQNNLLSILPRELIRRVFVILGYFYPDNDEELELYLSVRFGESFTDHRLIDKQSAVLDCSKHFIGIIDKRPAFNNNPARRHEIAFEDRATYLNLIHHRAVNCLRKFMDILPEKYPLADLDDHSIREVICSGSCEMIQIVLSAQARQSGYIRSYYIGFIPYGIANYWKILDLILNKCDNPVIALKILVNTGPSHDNPEIMQGFLDRGFEPNGIEIRQAIYGGMFKLLKWMIERFSIFGSLTNPILTAARFNRKEIFEYLLTIEEQRILYLTVDDNFEELTIDHMYYMKRLIDTFGSNLKKSVDKYFGDIVDFHGCRDVPDHRPDMSQRYEYFDFLHDNGFLFSGDEVGIAEAHGDEDFLHWYHHCRLDPSSSDDDIDVGEDV